MFFWSNCDLKIHGWSDFDLEGCLLTRRSISGWFVTLGTSPISWKTKKQDVVSMSLAEAEYRCMILTMCELKWLKPLLADLGVSHDAPKNLACDNQSALYITANPVFYERTKHREIDCHIVCDAVQDVLIYTKRWHLQSSLSTFLQKVLDVGNSNISNPSWTFVICTLQFEEKC